jgi:hypothetical protein
MRSSSTTNPPAGRVIRGLTFTSPVTLSRTEGEFTFESCVFEAGLAGKNLKSLTLKSCEVRGYVDFRGVRMGGDLKFMNSSFSGSLNLGIRGTRRSRFCRVTLEDCKVEGSVRLGGAKVFGQIRVENTHISGSLLFRLWEPAPNDRSSETELTHLYNSAHHTSALAIEAHGVHVGGDVSLRGALIRGRVVFTNAVIGGAFVARPWFAHHREDFKLIRRGIKHDEVGKPTSMKNLMCARIKVGGVVDLSGALIDGECDFDHADIGSFRLMTCEPDLLTHDSPSLPNYDKQRGYLADIPVARHSFPASDKVRRLYWRFKKVAAYIRCCADTSFIGREGAFVFKAQAHLDSALTKIGTLLVHKEKQVASYQTRISYGLRLRTAIIRGDLQAQAVYIGEGIDMSNADIHGNARIVGRPVEPHQMSSRSNQDQSGLAFLPSLVGGRRAYHDSEVSIWAVGSKISGSLMIAGSILTRGVNLFNSTIGGSVALDHLRGKATIIGVAEQRYRNENGEAGEQVRSYAVRLTGSTIKGNISFSGSLFAAGVSLESCTIGGDINGRSVSLLGNDQYVLTVIFAGSWTMNERASLLLNLARCDGDIDLRGSSLLNGIIAEGLRLSGSLMLNRPTKAVGTRLGCATSTMGARFSLMLSHAHIQGSVVCDGLIAYFGIRGSHAKIGGNFLLRSSDKLGQCKIGPGFHDQYLEKVAIKAEDARIGGNFEISSQIPKAESQKGEIDGLIHVNEMQVTGSVQISNVKIQPSVRKGKNGSEDRIQVIRMRQAKIGSDLGVVSLQVDEPLSVNDGFFGETSEISVDLTGTAIGGTFTLSDVADSLPENSMRSLVYRLRRVSCQLFDVVYSPSEYRAFSHHRFGLLAEWEIKYLGYLSILIWWVLWVGAGALLLYGYFVEGLILLFGIGAQAVVVRWARQWIGGREFHKVRYSADFFRASGVTFSPHRGTDKKVDSRGFGHFVARFSRGHILYGGVYPWLSAPYALITAAFVVSSAMLLDRLPAYISGEWAVPGLILLPVIAVLVPCILVLYTHYSRPYDKFEAERSFLNRFGRGGRGFRVFEDAYRAEGDHERADRVALQAQSSYIFSGTRLPTAAQSFHVILHFFIGHGVRWGIFIMLTVTLLIGGTAVFSNPESMESVQNRASQGGIVTGAARTAWLFLPIGKNLVDQDIRPSVKWVSVGDLHRVPPYKFILPDSGKLPLRYRHVALILMVSGWLIPPMLIYGLLKSAPRILGRSDPPTA